jgi:hypothetical protein
MTFFILYAICKLIAWMFKGVFLLVYWTLVILVAGPIWIVSLFIPRRGARW